MIVFYDPKNLISKKSTDTDYANKLYITHYFYKILMIYYLKFKAASRLELSISRVHIKLKYSLYNPLLKMLRLLFYSRESVNYYIHVAL